MSHLPLIRPTDVHDDKKDESHFASSGLAPILNQIRRIDVVAGLLKGPQNEILLRHALISGS